MVNKILIYVYIYDRITKHNFKEKQWLNQRRSDLKQEQEVLELQK